MTVMSIEAQLQEECNWRCSPVFFLFERTITTSAYYQYYLLNNAHHAAAAAKEQSSKANNGLLSYCLSSGWLLSEIMLNSGPKMYKIVVVLSVHIAHARVSSRFGYCVRVRACVHALRQVLQIFGGGFFDTLIWHLFSNLFLLHFL